MGLLSKVKDSKLVKILKALSGRSKKEETAECNSYTNAVAVLAEMQKNCLERGKLIKLLSKRTKSINNLIGLISKQRELFPEGSEMNRIKKEGSSKEAKKIVAFADDLIKDIDLFNAESEEAINGVLAKLQESATKFEELYWRDEGSLWEIHKGGEDGLEVTDGNHSFDFMCVDDIDKDSSFGKYLYGLSKTLEEYKKSSK